MKLIHTRIRLTGDLPRADALRLAARMRRFPAVTAASVRDGYVELWHEGAIPVPRILGAAQRAMREAAEKTVTPTEQLAEFRRDAVISLASFAAMELLRRGAPELFASVKVLRSLLVLAISRNFIKTGIGGLIKDRQPNADTLTTTAVIASVLAGKPESSLMLLALSNGAEMLTSYAAEKARTHISGLLSLGQRDVWLVEMTPDGEVERKVPVEEIRPGDTIAVHAGEKIAIDGRVLRGDAAVTQASITGESAPAMKHEGAPVYAGSVVEAGELVVAVEKVGGDTSLAHIVHLVEEAQMRRAPVQNFADQMANYLVPVSFLGAAIVYGATRDWGRVLNLLFIDFSCGLKLSTATAMSASIAAAAKRGILVKGGNYIEALARTDTLVLDKTGTLTVGVPEITFIRTAAGVDEKEVILLAASAEEHSVHPLAVAIQKYVEEQTWKTPQHRSSKTIVARGMLAEVPDFEGYTGGTVRVGSRRGVDEIVMLTGDAKAVAADVARAMDVDSYHAEILPEDKSRYVNQLKQRGTVMMVGDGINDAPALAFADVGVSLGGRQTDIAAESSAVTIHSEDPTRLVDALRLGQRTMHLVHQNFKATLLINSSAMLLGALGSISPLAAAAIHNTATLGVVLNSCRILTPEGGIFARRAQS